MWEQLQRLLASLNARQKISIVVVTMSVAGAMYWFLNQRREQDFRPLFSGLAAADASRVVAKLKEANVDYRLSDNGAVVLVRSARVADTRLLVAAAGLPKSGRIGFEIFDKTNFGATDFAEQINFRRALEGELERSITSIEEVEEARVHLSFAKESVFLESRLPAKASVLIKLRSAARISQQNVTAIEHLVASAVEGLTPDGVTVVDMQGNLLKKRPISLDGADGDSGPLEYRHSIERDMLAKIYSTLVPVLGADHVKASVSAEVDFSSGEQSEETWDPNRSVMSSQQRTEETNAPNSASGVPGTASNLPRPTSRPGSSGSHMVRRTENITYQSSRMVRKTTLPKGSLRRISISAIIDQNVRWEGAGPKAKRILEPPSEDTLKKVRDLIAGAVGFQQERGDQIIIQSLPFETTLVRSAPPPDPLSPQKTAPPPLNPVEKFLADKNIKVDPMVLIGATAGVVMLLVGAVVFLLMRKKKAPTVDFAAKSAELAHGATGALHAAGSTVPAVHGDAGSSSPPVSIEQRLERQMATQEAERAQAEVEMLNSLKAPAAGTKKTEVLVKHISEQAKRDPTAVAQLMRTWIVEKEERY